MQHQRNSSSAPVVVSSQPVAAEPRCQPALRHSQSQQQLLLTGHPREGQAASLLGNKYLLLEELEGSSLHRCLHLPTRQEFVCKVSILPRFLPSVLVFVHGAGCEYS